MKTIVSQSLALLFAPVQTVSAQNVNSRKAAWATPRRSIPDDNRYEYTLMAVVVTGD